MKYKIILIIILFSVSVTAQLKEKKLIQSFLIDMFEMEDLNKYVYNSEGYTIDFYLVDEYVINDYENNVLTVDINTGGGEFWTRLYFEFIEDKGKLYVRGKISNNPTIMTAWYDKNKVCPQN